MLDLAIVNFGDINLHLYPSPNRNKDMGDDKEIYRDRLVNLYRRHGFEKVGTKNRMERMRTFEQFKGNDNDPYNEENWGEGPQSIDLSQEDPDYKVEYLQKLFEEGDDIRMSEQNVDFYYIKKVIESWDDDGFDEEFGPGNDLDEIFEVFLNEDGDIIFQGIRQKYIEDTDDYDDHPVFYTVDVNHPIYFGKGDKQIEIKL